MRSGDELIKDFSKSFRDGFLDKYAPIRGSRDGWNAVVIVARKRDTDSIVVLKLYRRLFLDHRKALGALREIKYLSQLKHPNITRIINVAGKRKLYFTDVFVEMEHDGISLDEMLLTANTYFSDALDQENCMRQILIGLAYMHSAQLAHRNLQPRHILSVYGFSYQIADFHHTRKISDDPNDNLTQSVDVSRYSSPEILLCPQRLTTSCDIYSAGLIFIQVFLKDKTPFLSGDSRLMQLRDLFRKTGRPLDEDLSDLSEEGLYLLRKDLPDIPHKTWAETLPSLPTSATNLLEGMLQFASSRRFTAVQALECDIFNGLGELPADVPLHYEGPPLEDYDGGITLPAILAKIRDTITVDLSTGADTEQQRPLEEDSDGE